MESIPYEYEPLTSASSFRLLHLKRPQSCLASRSGTIEIDLFEASLECPPEFEAVSYAWGEEVANTTILCNGQVHRATPTVVSILRTLQQREDSAGIIWIDSICINQSAVLERNIQVPKMRTIYHEAKNVWIWLGEGSYENETTFGFLSEAAEILEENGLSTWKPFLLPSIPNSLNQLCDRFADTINKRRGFNDAVDTNFIVDILNLPWFHRTWPVQELVLARKAVLLCGSKCISWSWFTQTLQVLQDKENRGALVRRLDPISNPASFYDELGCYRTLEKLLHDQNPVSPISTALGFVRTKSSSDPRDKVYAMYGIFDFMQILGLPQVDYSKTTQQIYVETAIATIKFERSLDILYHVGMLSLIPALPSWVPDWSNTEFIRPIHSQESHASGSSAPIFSSDRLQLVVFGTLIDHLHEVADSTSVCTANFRRGYNARMDFSNTEERYCAVVELIRTLQSWIRISRRVHAYPTGEPPLEAFFRTITQNLMGKLRIASNLPAFEIWTSILTANFPDSHINLYREIQDRSGYTQIRDEYASLFGCGRNVEEWEDELMIRMFLRLHSFGVARIQHEISLNNYQRTFFTTRDGYMGIGPRWSRPSDSVALISGLNVPFIVRNNGQDYILVGPAYIHGIMEGERWNKDRLERIALI